MGLPPANQFAEIRRGLPLVASALLLVALLLPMWAIDVHAVQYPDQVLHLDLYAYPHIAGDYVEMHRLNKYIGFYYPDPVYWTPNFPVHEHAVKVPEWSVAPLAFVAVAGAGAFVSVAPTVGKLKRGLRWQLVGSVTVLVVMFVDIQYRLYQTGHSLDPEAPVMGVDPFTPPIWGRYEVANITSYSRLGPGAFLTLLAIALIAVAYYHRNTDATLAELPAVLRGDLERARDRVVGGDERAGSR